MLIKLVIFGSFTHIKYSCCFINSHFNHNDQMDHFNDVISTFLDIDRNYYHYVYQEKPLGCYQKYLYLCSKYAHPHAMSWVSKNDKMLISGELSL